MSFGKTLCSLNQIKSASSLGKNISNIGPLKAIIIAQKMIKQQIANDAEFCIFTVTKKEKVCESNILFFLRNCPFFHPFYPFQVCIDKTKVA
jgi:hypothetical protein